MTEPLKLKSNYQRPTNACSNNNKEYALERLANLLVQSVPLLMLLAQLLCHRWPSLATMML